MIINYNDCVKLHILLKPVIVRIISQKSVLASVKLSTQTKAKGIQNHQGVGLIKPT